MSDVPPTPDGRRPQVAVRMRRAGIAAVDARVTAVQARAAERGVKPPTRSDVIRWLVEDAHKRHPALDWMPGVPGVD